MPKPKPTLDPLASISRSNYNYNHGNSTNDDDENPSSSTLRAGENPFPTATSCETNIEDYIGSGTSSGGGPSPRAFLPTLRGPGSDDDDRDLEFELEEMDHSDRRPPFLRHADGKSGEPLLYKPDDEDDQSDRGRDRRSRPVGAKRVRTMSPGRSRSPGDAGMESPFLRGTSHGGGARPTFSRRSTMRSVSPGELARDVARQRYTYAAFFLVLILVAFVVQTELSVYIQKDLGWNKAYCMLYFTHGSWVVLWPVQLLVLRIQKRDLPWSVFWRRHVALLRSTALMVRHQTLEVDRPSVARKPSPVWYMIKMTAFVTSALTVAGLSWYIAVDLTSASDLTAIYNCSAFFAYVFSVPLLKEPLRLDKSIAVAIAIGGVLVVAYGDSKPAEDGVEDPALGSRFLGNMVIGVGSVLYGLYEVLYKRYACPPDGVSPGRGTIFANTFGSLIGAFTLLVLWIPLPLLHLTGLEPFVFPTGRTFWLLLLSVLANATFAGSFLVLISLTSPVLSSVASLLTIFFVALTDWWLTGEPLTFAAIVGGVMITVAFVMLSLSTWREMNEEVSKEFEAVFSDSDASSDTTGSDQES